MTSEADQTDVDEQEERYFRQRAIESSGMPKIFRDKIRSGLIDTDATRALADGPDGLVVVSGPPGCGKTVSACAWIAAGIVGTSFSYSPSGREIRQPYFVTAARLSRWDRYDNDAINVLLRAPRLALDDIGSEYADAKGNFLAVFDEVIADRASNARPTVVTTNLSAAAFKDRYGERIADRIRESGRFVSLTGASLRTPPKR
jgi:DNA replication protein DnaC